MTIALVFETSVTVNNIPTRDCTTPDDHIPPYTKTSVHVKIAFHKEMTECQIDSCIYHSLPLSTKCIESVAHLFEVLLWFPLTRFNSKVRGGLAGN